MEFLAILLISISAGIGFFYISQVLVRLFNAGFKQDDDWRDPPPLIFKLFKPFVKAIAPDLKAFMSEKQLKKTEGKLTSGGMNYAILPEEFATLRFVCLLVGSMGAAYVYVNYKSSIQTLALMMVIPPISYFYPDIWLNDKIKARKVLIVKDFPFLLDLMILAMRAGLNYSSALAQSINSLDNGPVKDEFSKILRDIRAGKPRSEALSELANRVDIPSIHNFVAAMNQAEETGGEMVEILSTQVEQRRSERFIAAEELANKAPVKMLAPMMLLLFPIIFMLIGFIIAVGLAEANVLPPALAKAFM